MKPFNLEEWLQNKSRKIRTREGKDVEIIYTNSPVPYHPIIGFIDKSIYTWTIDGKLIYGKEEQDKNDLFFADEEEDEFETTMISFSHVMFNYLLDITKEVNIKEWKEKLINLARKEILEDLPKWEKNKLPNSESYMGFTGSYFCYRGYNINYDELFEKLPKEE